MTTRWFCIGVVEGGPCNLRSGGSGNERKEVGEKNPMMALRMS